jgi:hypothetical protein
MIQLSEEDRQYVAQSIAIGAAIVAQKEAIAMDALRYLEITNLRPGERASEVVSELYALPASKLVQAVLERRKD